MSPLVHAGVALAGFAIIAPFLGPAAGALAGIAAYWGREGAQAQHAAPRPKAETWWMPWAPWTWPLQMQLDAAAPALAMLAAWGAWSWAF